MKVIYCEISGDINIVLSRKEAEELKRTNDFTPSLDAISKGRTFHLMNTNIKNINEIDVKEPNTPSYNHYWVRIKDSTYDNLMKTGRIGDRLIGGSKVNIVLEEML